MGCAVSNLTEVKPHDAFTKPHKLKRTKRTGTHELSKEEKRVIKKSWKILSADISALETNIFFRLFEINPAIKLLFAHQEKHTDRREFRVDEVVFKGHATRLAQSIGTVVDHIDELGPVIAPLLVEIGKQHFTFNGFHSSFWDSCPDAILYIWKDAFKERFTVEAANAWSSLLRFMVETLKEGYNSACGQTFSIRKEDK